MKFAAEAVGYARYPDCHQTDTSGTSSTYIYCPTGEFMWSKTQFSVPFGQAGALSLVGTSTGSAVIDSTIFRNNSAGDGSAINALGELSLLQTCVW